MYFVEIYIRPACVHVQHRHRHSLYTWKGRTWKSVGVKRYKLRSGSIQNKKRLKKLCTKDNKVEVYIINSFFFHIQVNISTKPVFLQFFNENSWNPRNFIEFYFMNFIMNFSWIIRPIPVSFKRSNFIFYYIISGLFKFPL